MDRIRYIQNHDINNSIREIYRANLVTHMENVVVKDDLSEIEDFLSSHFVTAQNKEEGYQAIYDFCKSKCQGLVKHISLYPMYNKLSCDFTSILADALCEILRGLQWNIIGYRQKMDNSYTAVGEIEYWCGWYLGILLNEREEYHTLKHLLFLSDCNLSGVLETYRITDKLFEELLSSDILEPINLLKMKRVLEDEQTASNYIAKMENLFERQGEEDVEGLLVRSQYCQPNELVMMLSYSLLLNKRYELWAKLFERLRYPILQAMMYLPYTGCEGYEEVMKFIIRSNAPTTYLFCSIIQSFWIKSFIATQVNVGCLKKNVRKDLGEDFRKDINEAVYQWEESRYRELNAFMEICTRYFGIGTLTKLVFSKMSEFPTSKTDLGIATNETFNMMKGYISTNVKVEDLPLNVDNFRYLLFILNTYIGETDVDNGNFECVLNRVLKVLFSSDFYKNIEFEEETLNEIRCISAALCKRSIKDIKEKINQCTTIFEGYDFSINENIHKYVMHECFFMCACILMVEQDEPFKDEQSKGNWIKFLTTHLLRQIHVCGYEHLIRHYYVKCLILIELVVIQILNSYKEEYEMGIIRQVDDLVTLLTILNVNGVSLSNENKEILRNRIDKELAIKGEVLEQQKNERLKGFIEKAACKLLQ